METVSELKFQCFEEAIQYRNIAFHVNPDLFYLKLHQVVDNMYAHPDDYKIDDKYLHVLNFCLDSKATFQHFYNHTAALMTEHNYPLNVQSFIDQFIFDIRIRQASVDVFSQMYEPDFYFYVKIIIDENLNHLGNHLLKHLQHKNYRKFVILCTHFEVYRHLLQTK